MKISKSKQELARIISENGGWRDGAEFAAQDQNAAVTFFVDTPWRCGAAWEASGFEAVDGFGVTAKALTNWHQTILSRDEYFHLYQAPDADGWIEWKGGSCPVGRGTLVDVKYADSTINCGVSALTNSAHEDHVFGTCGIMTAANWGAGLPMSGIIAYRLHKPEQSEASQAERDEQVWTNPPSIEQLAADYRNAKDYAELKQKEADDAKADADEKLRVLELAGEAIGLLVSPITEKQEPDLVLEVKVGDEVECVESNIKRDKYNGTVGRLHTIDEDDTPTPYLVDFGGEAKIWCHEVKFIRRP